MRNKLIFFFTLLGAGGCSLFSPPPPPEQQPEAVIERDSEAPIVDLEKEPTQADPRASETDQPKSKGKKVTGIEITWKAPRRPVKLYHLYYGDSPSTLTNHLVLPAEKLSLAQDAEHGAVYRYELMGIDPKKELFVEIRAENQSGVSSPSMPIRVPLPQRAE